jgi:hypothetical protein
VNTNFSALLNIHPGLNPWLVVLLSAIAGLLAFAVCNALYVVHVRRKRTPLATRSVTRLRTTVTSTAAVLLVLAGIALTPGPTLVESRGWLSGDDLFSVTSRAGFAASYPNAERKVKKGDVILQLVRDAGPDEVAAAAHQRALLAQDLEFARLETLKVDPLLLAEHASAKSELDDLVARKRAIAENQESLQRGARRDELADQKRLADIENALQAARHELEQTEASFKTATVSFDIASKPNLPGLFSGDEIAKRQERVAVLSSRREEVGERVALLASERARLQKLTAASDETHAEHMAHGGAELEDLDQQLTAAREHVHNAWAAVEHDKQRAEQQREYRVREIELQLAEYDELLNAKKDLLDVKAPWDGFVGFREPSPATAAIGNRPLLVLYKPGSIAVKVPVPTGHALAQTDNIDVEMQALTPEAASSTFAGRVAQSVDLPDGSGELQIVGDPPEAAIRELATGSAVPVYVIIRRLNPLAAAKIGWLWWLAAAGALGFAVSELRQWRARAHARAATAAGTTAAKHTSSVLNWGGDPEEFLEYVVGVGIVRRKLRRATSVEVAEERRATVPSGDRRRQQG